MVDGCSGEQVPLKLPTWPTWHPPRCASAPLAASPSRARPALAMLWGWWAFLEASSPPWVPLLHHRHCTPRFWVRIPAPGADLLSAPPDSRLLALPWRPFCTNFCNLQTNAQNCGMAVASWLGHLLIRGVLAAALGCLACHTRAWGSDILPSNAAPTLACMRLHGA